MREIIVVSRKDIIPIYNESLAGIAPIIFSEDEGLRPNPILTKGTPYMLTWDEQANDSVLSVAANGVQRRAMSNDKAGMIDLRRIKGTATSDEYRIYIFDNEYQRYLSNRQIHSNLIVGNGLRPYKLPIPLLLHETQSLIFDVTDLSGVPNDIRLTLEGHRYYFDAKKLFDQMSPATMVTRPFFYTTDSDVTITAAVGTAEVLATITFISDGDFYLKNILAYSDGAFRVRITDTGTGLNLMNGWIHSNILGGDSEYNVDFNPAMMFQRKTQVNLRFINLSGVDNRIFFAFAGYNAYYRR